MSAAARLCHLVPYALMRDFSRWPQRTPSAGCAALAALETREASPKCGLLSFQPGLG
jgi:hypothetical protein